MSIQFCIEIGGLLAEPRSSEEQSGIQSFIFDSFQDKWNYWLGKKLYPFLLPLLFKFVLVIIYHLNYFIIRIPWRLGLTDLANEGTFLWESDLREPELTWWLHKPPFADEPNDLLGIEDCVMIGHDTQGLWADIYCYNATLVARTELHALCQLSL